MTGIYLITNKLNGKQYVGQSKDISKRLKEHKYGSLHIDNAIKKYGIENFYIDVILECPEDMLDVWEKDMISLYDTYNTDNGYNHTEGGDKGPTMCGEKNPMYGVHRYGKDNPNFGNHPISPNKGGHISEESKRKNSETQKEQYRNGRINPMTGVHRYGKDSPRYGKKERILKWMTPIGEIKYMCRSKVMRWHKDWKEIINIEKVEE